MTRERHCKAPEGSQRTPCPKCGRLGVPAQQSKHIYYINHRERKRGSLPWVPYDVCVIDLHKKP